MKLILNTFIQSDCNKIQTQFGNKEAQFVDLIAEKDIFVPDEKI